MQEPCYRRENRAMPLLILIGIEFYNGIVQLKVNYQVIKYEAVGMDCSFTM